MQQFLLCAFVSRFHLREYTAVLWTQYRPYQGWSSLNKLLVVIHYVLCIHDQSKIFVSSWVKMCITCTWFTSGIMIFVNFVSRCCWWSREIFGIISRTRPDFLWLGWRRRGSVFYFRPSFYSLKYYTIRRCGSSRKWYFLICTAQWPILHVETIYVSIVFSI